MSATKNDIDKINYEVLPQKNLSAAEQKVWSILYKVQDPEIPVISIVDLGIVQKVALENEKLTVWVTPTYSGCPATDMIAVNIRLALISHGYKIIEIVTVLSPAWGTHMITDAGKAKMLRYGIAPPKDEGDKSLPACPQCGHEHTKLLSQFGSTACKALYQCEDCREPFDYFKCH